MVYSAYARVCFALKTFVLISIAHVPMTSSPDESSNSSTELDSFVLAATSSQDCLDENAVVRLAGYIAADPNALELQCMTNSTMDIETSSNMSTLPLISMEG